MSAIFDLEMNMVFLNHNSETKFFDVIYE